MDKKRRLIEIRRLLYENNEIIKQAKKNIKTLKKEKDMLERGNKDERFKNN